MSLDIQTKRQAQMRARYINNHKKPEPETDISHQAKVRQCLKCAKSFKSEGHHNRVCRDCKDLKEWKSSVEAPYSVGYRK